MDKKLVGEDIAKRLKAVRGHFGVTQEELANILEINVIEIKNLEGNNLKALERKRPLLKLVCYEFGVSRNWLFFGEGEMLLSGPEDVDVFTENIRSSPTETALLKSLMSLGKDDRNRLYETLIKLFKPLVD